MTKAGKPWSIEKKVYREKKAFLQSLHATLGDYLRDLVVSYCFAEINGYLLLCFLRVCYTSARNNWVRKLN